MGANIEIKARVRDWDGLRARAEALSDTPVERIEQDDTFYNAPRGRLKLRVLAPDRGELIYYERPDAASVRQSSYEIVPVPDPAALNGVLLRALGERVRVRKWRWLYRSGQTRIHLDEVEGLGRFMELEYVLRPGEEHEAGTRAVEELLARLGVVPEDFLKSAYADLKISRNETATRA